MNGLSALPQPTIHQLGLQWSAILKEENLRPEGVRECDRRRRLAFDMMSGLHSEHSRYREANDAAREIGLRASVNASVRWFHAIVFEYTQLGYCIKPNDLLPDWIEQIKGYVLSALTTRWKCCSRATDKWFEEVCRPVVTTALTSAAYERMNVRRGVGSSRENMGSGATECSPAISDGASAVVSSRNRKGDAQIAKRARAKTVAILIAELNVLKPQMFEDEPEYRRLSKQYPNYLTFKIAENRPDLKLKIIAIQGSSRHIRLAQELAAANHGRALSTIQDDWKHFKPSEYKRQS
jgi:hypothetical protein